MKIAIVGAGSVGRTLGTAWAERGHAVSYGVRDPAKAVGLVGLSVAEAVAGADVVTLALPWHAVAGILNGLDLAGKTVIDCTNPIADDFSGLDDSVTPSAGETIARLAPSAMVVKAFNTTGYNVMADPRFGQQAAAMFLCGDDLEAKQIVAQLASEIGFDPVDAGPLSQSAYLEAAAWLWISMATKYGYGREVAYAWLRR